MTLSEGLLSGTRRKVFVSYHHGNDQWDREKFEGLFAKIYGVMITKSVQLGDISTSLPTDTVRQKIRDEYLRDSTVTVVLIGKETWKRKHVDWEIASSIRNTKLNKRSGLLGILLPDHPDYGKEKYNPYIIPPRLHHNAVSKYAAIHDWSDNPINVKQWIENAFEKRFTVTPDNSYPSFINNKYAERWTP
jgi:Thoeris protein ThsB, TIR-like domain